MHKRGFGIAAWDQTGPGGSLSGGFWFMDEDIPFTSILAGS
jgi:hypothetical protein